MSWRFWELRAPLYRTVIVNLRHDENVAIRGIAWKSRGEYLILKNASFVTAGRESQQLDGEQLIRWDNVAWVQMLS